MILENARIWTGDPDRPWAEALRIEDGRIAAVGTRPEVERPGHPCRDLEGRLVVPGLWDAHIHLYDWSLARQQVGLVGCRTREEALQRIERHAARTPVGRWVVGWGWNAGEWEDPRLPDRRELDLVTHGRPALFLRSDMHSGLANTAALAAVGFLDAPPVDGGEIVTDDGGRPTGLLLELALNPLRTASAPKDGEALDVAIEQGLAHLHEFGVTAVCDQRLKDQAEGPRTLQALAKLFRQGRLRTRVRTNVAVHDLHEYRERADLPELQSDLLKLGHVKIFSDGALGSRTARMLEPYEGEPQNRGIWATAPEHLEEDFRKVADSGLPISVHAIGDEGVRVCLDLLERLPRRTQGPPHRMEHVQIATEHDLQRLAPMGLTASLQPAHALDDMDLADRWLRERAGRAYRFATLHRTGALLAFGSDAPVADPDPFYGMHGAVHRSRKGREPWYPEERLGLPATLRAYTWGAAKAAGCEHVTGTLRAGKAADLAVLDRDLFAHGEILGTRALLTIVDGEIVYER